MWIDWLAGSRLRLPGRVVLVVTQMRARLGLQAAFQDCFEHLGQEPTWAGQAAPVGA